MTENFLPHEQAVHAETLICSTTIGAPAWPRSCSLAVTGSAFAILVRSHDKPPRESALGRVDRLSAPRDSSFCSLNLDVYSEGGELRGASV